MGKVKTFAIVLALSLVPTFLLVVLGLILIRGLAVTDYLIDSGVDEFEGVEKKQARAALFETELWAKEVFSPVGALRVTSVKQCPPGADLGDPPDICWEGCLNKPLPGEIPRHPLPPYLAEVRVYGPFGIPMSTMRWSCDGTGTLGGREVVGP